jgi:hypothetical protein
VTFQRGLQQAEKAVDTLLNLISGWLGLDHDRVLGDVYAFPLLARYLIQCGGVALDSHGPGFVASRELPRVSCRTTRTLSPGD